MLVAAAIAAILSGCGGGDEGGSDNQVIPPTEDTIAVSTETPQDTILPTSEKKDVQRTAKVTRERSGVVMSVTNTSEGTKAIATTNGNPKATSSRSRPQLMIPETPVEIAQGTPTPTITKKSIKSETYVAPVQIAQGTPDPAVAKKSAKGRAYVVPERIDQGKPNTIPVANPEVTAQTPKPFDTPAATPALKPQGQPTAIPTANPQVVAQTPEQVVTPSATPALKAQGEPTPAIAKKSAKGRAYVVPERIDQGQPNTIPVANPEVTAQTPKPFDTPTATPALKPQGQPTAIPTANPQVVAQTPEQVVTPSATPALKAQGEPTPAIAKKSAKGEAYAVPKQTTQLDIEQVQNNQARSYADIQGEIVEYGLSKGLEGQEISQIGFIAHDMINSGGSAQGALLNAKLNIDRVYNARQETPAEIAQGTPTPIVVKKAFKGEAYVTPVQIAQGEPNIPSTSNNYGTQTEREDAQRADNQYSKLALEESIIRNAYAESKQEEQAALWDSYAEHDQVLEAKAEATYTPDDTGLIDDSFPNEEVTVATIPAALTPEVVKQQSALLESVCLTNTQQFVETTGYSTSGGIIINDVQLYVTSDEDRLSYSMEMFAMLQQLLANNPDFQQAEAGELTGNGRGNGNRNIKTNDKKWTLTMDTGASYTLSTTSSLSYQPTIEIVVDSNGAIIFRDSNGIETARIVSNNQNGDCTNASYDVVLAN
ncbi:hypothetical protein [Vibrio sp. EA2]|uniref:hypothetical protein n=1 Tax=Vibrio sp. EA2 TaxID=3079860 RepID=UPI00294A8AF8|nr:hypothetical protein [Vibrio sp. EA2]MDV6250065.1 hypothetical protein [Vibrio sp. EA2]